MSTPEDSPASIDTTSEQPQSFRDKYWGWDIEHATTVEELQAILGIANGKYPHALAHNYRRAAVQAVQLGHMDLSQGFQDKADVIDIAEQYNNLSELQDFLQKQFAQLSADLRKELSKNRSTQPQEVALHESTLTTLGTVVAVSVIAGVDQILSKITESTDEGDETQPPPKPPLLM